MSTFLSTARRGHAGLFGFAVLMLLASGVFAVLATVDHRTLVGAPLWFKPLKFSISFSAYAVTLAWLMGRLNDPPLRRTGWVIAWASGLEVVIIGGQAARGVRSHFNDDDAFGRAVWHYGMAAIVVVLYVATVVVLLRILRERGADPATTLAARAGLGIAVLGMGIGFIMSFHGGHAVGTPDGGPGLFLLNWSTTGGDLRVGHFIGMHALQAIPLLAAALLGRLGSRTTTRIVAVVASAYLAFTVLVTVQALRAQPFTEPDAITGVALAVIVLSTAAGLVAALREVEVDTTDLEEKQPQT